MTSVILFMRYYRQFVFKSSLNIFSSGNIRGSTIKNDVLLLVVFPFLLLLSLLIYDTFQNNNGEMGSGVEYRISALFVHYYIIRVRVGGCRWFMKWQYILPTKPTYLTI